MESADRGGVTSWGTGTCVASTKESLILTANHVIQDGHGFKINGKVAKLIGIDSTWDLAALTTQAKLPSISLSNRRPPIGEVLTACGYGSGSYKEVSGKVMQYFNPGRNLPDDWLALNISVRQGDSGGPILSARRELVGVLFGSDTLGVHGSCCTRVRLFIENLNIEPKLKQQALSNPYTIIGK
jgi:S1-C subfamily serine protease